MDEQAALPAPAMDENKEAIPSMAPPGKEDGMALRSDAVAPPGKKDEMALRSDADAEMWKVNPVAMLGNGGVILVLFETPSGFALFSYDGLKLFQPDAIHNIWGEFVKDFMRPVWLKDFKPFKDKASALNLDTGVNKDLASMIGNVISPDQKLAVGKREYKIIIEHYLGISCLYSDEVMELMWGLQNLMPHYLPKEVSKMTKDDCLPMCKGIMFLLNSYGFDVKPEMVNENIIEMACLVLECDFNVKKHAKELHYAGELLKAISEIDFEDWDLLKLATALMIVGYPKGEQIVAGNLQKLFGDDYSTLVKDAPKYKDKLREVACFRVYEEMLWARKLRFKGLKRLATLARMAREDYETEQAMRNPGEIPEV
ncbi:unnamed protein product [Urochloa decumbens]|uniref:Nucleolar protein 58/56 N-terminal domain-containing protein n=1 Tax=Urochloa decumbens TaxID=240449 RepID=A0ABC8XS79_9POAL